MCLLVIAWRVHPRYRLVVAANRDEFHARPTAPMARWPAPDDFVAGRDLLAGGTWLGINRNRRFGTVTNFRELQRPLPEAPSRGLLIPQYLRGEDLAERFIGTLKYDAARYSGFNLLLADERALWYVSNREKPFGRALAPGIYGLSNERLDSPWPKLRRVRARFDGWLTESIRSIESGLTDAQRTKNKTATTSAEELFDILSDRTRVDDGEILPSSGLPLEWERILSSPFVTDTEYGTRCSTVLLLEVSGALRLAERRFDSTGAPSGETVFQLDAGRWL